MSDNSKRYAIIEGGIVTNIIKLKAFQNPDPWGNAVDITDLDENPGINWFYDGDSFSKPPMPPGEEDRQAEQETAENDRRDKIQQHRRIKQRLKSLKAEDMQNINDVKSVIIDLKNALILLEKSLSN